MVSTDETTCTSDGLDTFTDSKSVMARWSEYFQKLLNFPGDRELEALENIHRCSVNTALDEKPTMYQMVRAIKGIKDGKTPGGDGIPAEVWKYGGTNLSNRLHRWLIKIWEEGHVPQAWKDASIVIIYKNETGQNVITEVYLFFCSRQDLCSDPTEQTLNPYYSRGGARDVVRLSFIPKHC